MIPNTYILGASPEIDIEVYDSERQPLTPDRVRLSIESPDGSIVTVSGEALSTASGYLYYIYKPLMRGFYVYEVWAADSSGHEGTSDPLDTNGFEIIDIVP
jgi:hypothetical protein